EPEKSVYRVLPQKDVPWEAALGKAKTRICASGVALSKIDPRIVAEKIKAGVNVRLIYANPCGPAVQLKQRQTDEHNPDASSNVTSTMKRFGQYSKDLSTAQKQALNVMLTAAYPTMVVMIIDDDLYTYFCPYGAVCTTSPVLIFENYREKSPDTAGF